MNTRSWTSTASPADLATPAARSARARVLAAAGYLLDLAVLPVLEPEAAVRALEGVAPVLPGAPRALGRRRWRQALVDAADALLRLRDPEHAVRRLSRDATLRGLAFELLERHADPVREPEREALRAVLAGEAPEGRPLVADLLDFSGAAVAQLADAHRLVRVYAVACRWVDDEPDRIEAGRVLLGLEEDALESLRLEATRRAEEEGASLVPADQLDSERLRRRVRLHQQLRLAGADFVGVAGHGAAVAGIGAAARDVLGTTAGLALVRDDHLELAGLGDLDGERLALTRTGSLAARVLGHGQLAVCEGDDPEAAVIDLQIMRRLGCGGLIAVPMLDPVITGALLVPADADPDEVLALGAHASAWLAAAIGNAVEATRSCAALHARYERSLREVVHEASNPLAVIRNYFHVLRTRFGNSPEAAEPLELIGDEIRRTSEIIETLRELPARLARAEGDGPEASRNVDANAMVEDVLRLVEPSLRASGVQLRRRLTRTPVSLRLDGDRLRQVLLNLVRNALEAMPEGGTLEVATSEQVVDDQGRRFEIRVADSGGGIAPPMLDALFEADASSKGDGRGLGLHIVRRLVGELGGSITAQPRPEGGTDFRVLLPRG